MDWHFSNPVVNLPGPPISDPAPGEQTRLGASQHGAVVKRQDLVDQLAVEATFRCEAFPFPVASPACQAAPGESQPDRVFPVSQHRIHRTLQALALADGPEMPHFVDGQSLDRRHEQPTAGVHLQLASSSRLWKTWIRCIEAHACVPHDGKPLKVVHPQVAASIATDAHPFSGRQAVRLAEHGHPLAGHPAQPGAAPVPHSIRLQQDAVRTRTIGAGRPVQRPEGGTVRAGRCCCHDETAVRRDECLALAVELDGTVAVDACALKGHCFEAIAFLLVEPTPVSDQHTPIRHLAQTQDHVVWKALGWPVTLKPLTVVAEHAVLGSSPQKACPILKEHLHGGIGQPVLRSVVAEAVLLRLDGRGRSQARQDGREAQERRPPHSVKMVPRRGHPPRCNTAHQRWGREGLRTCRDGP